MKTTQDFINVYMKNSLLLLNIFLIMLRQSEIANFLDLIKHITEARSFKNSNTIPKPKKINRYDESDQNGEPLSNEKRTNNKSLAVVESSQSKKNDSKLQSEFEHKMLKITHEIKKKPKSLKIDSFEYDKQHFQSDGQLGKKISLTRSSLYENYCQMIQRKRQQKITKMFQSSQHQINQNICNISDTVHFQKGHQNYKSFKQYPFIKSKTLKPGMQSIKIKHPKHTSKKKVQPSELNIEPLKSVKMPKLQNHLGTRRRQFKADKYISPYTKKVVINKAGNLEGWAAQEEEKTCFNIDYF